MSSKLTRAVQAARRACKRGMGPARHSAPLPFARLVDPVLHIAINAQPWAPGGPLYPLRTLVLGSWWLCREIEISNTLVEDIELDKYAGRATWNLSASKADPSALGASRSHFCSCVRHAADSAGRVGAIEAPDPLCPFCLLEAQRKFAVAFARQAGVSTPDVPLFPTQEGLCPGKSALVTSIVQAAKRIGLPTETKSGAPAFGGHSLRIGGVQHLARSGIDIWRIQALARHSSNAILTYLDGIHAKNLGNIAAEAQLGRSIASMRTELKLLKDHVGAGQPDQVNAALKPRPFQRPVATTVAEVLPEPDLQPPLPATGLYVRSRG